MILRVIFILFGFLGLTSIRARAQVVNNNIENRLRLYVDSLSIQSTTANATIQNDCISSQLTGKCVVYHNDQWFEFSVLEAGKYYLNVFGQNCRNELGVQVIIIEGNPCETQTYRLIDCISLQSQDNVYVVMDSLVANETYLVNIDGFLGDFCDFEIEVSSQLSGLPIYRPNRQWIEMDASIQEKVVTINWHVSQENISGIQEFLIYRRKARERNRSAIEMAPIVSNALGVFQLDYVLTDTLLQPGAYVYEIYGRMRINEGVELLNEEQITFTPPIPAPPPAERSLGIPVDYADHSSYQVIVMDADLNTVLTKISGITDELEDKILILNMEEYLDQGVVNFLILTTSDFGSRNTIEHYFKYEEGKFLKEE